MKYINKVIEELERQSKLHKFDSYNYEVPALWNNAHTKGIPTYRNGIIVNPYTFYYENIKALVHKKKQQNYLQPLSTIKNRNSKGGKWIKSAFAYSCMIRTSAAYDHDRDGYVTQKNMYGLKESGTFIKFLVLIPYLKRMGINTIYLLPFFKTSDYDKKGEFGSCYAVRDFFEIDETLQDPMITNMNVNEQCKAFMEVCHMHDLRVIIDIIPRTNAIRSQFLSSHPDWFYWIKKEYAKDFKAPVIDSVGKLAVATNDIMEKVYQHPNCKAFLEQFSFDPKTIDPEKYENVVERANKKHLDLLNEIEKEYGLTVACAFSDQVNDPQPVWSDVTFLRMYLDHPKLAKKYIDEKQAPYILFDVAKSNLHPGEKENRELWDTIINFIPFYQNQYGIDGVRIDMGHALPLKLVDEMLNKARENDPDICIIAEELDTRNDKISAEKGYNMILGNGFSEECRILEHRLHDFYYGARDLALPLFALGETHDTPRISARDGGKTLTNMLTLLNLFMPNGVAFLNSGQEFYEVQPMNLGLDCRENERWRLDKKDPRYGKLALFDSFYFTYDTTEMIELLEKVIPIRKEYINEIKDVKKSIPAWFVTPWDLGLGSFFVKKEKAILVVANADMNEERVYEVQLENVLKNLKFYPKKCREIFSNMEDSYPGYIESLHHIYVRMKPGELKIIEIE